MNDYPMYMDYPFLCDEKTGDRCHKQCEACKEAQEKRWQQKRDERPTGDKCE